MPIFLQQLLDEHGRGTGGGNGPQGHVNALEAEERRKIIDKMLDEGRLVLNQQVQVINVHTSSIPLTGRDAVDTPEIRANLRRKIIRAIQDKCSINDLAEFNALSYCRPDTHMPSFDVDLMPLAYYTFLSLCSYLDPKMAQVTNARGETKETHMTFLHACRNNNFSLPPGEGYWQKNLDVKLLRVFRTLGFCRNVGEPIDQNKRYIWSTFTSWIKEGTFSFAGEKNCQTATETGGTFFELVRKIAEVMHIEGEKENAPDYTHCISFVAGMRTKMIEFQEQKTPHNKILEYFRKLINNPDQLREIIIKGEGFRIDRLTRAVEMKLESITPVPASPDERQYFHDLLKDVPVSILKMYDDETIYSTTHSSLENIFPKDRIAGVGEQEHKNLAAGRGLNKPRLACVFVSDGNIANSPETGMLCQRFSIVHEALHLAAWSPIVLRSQDLLSKLYGLKQRAQEIGSNLSELGEHPYLEQQPLAIQTLQSKTIQGGQVNTWTSTWKMSDLHNVSSNYYSGYTRFIGLPAEEALANLIALPQCTDIILNPLSSSFSFTGNTQTLCNLIELQRDTIEFVADVAKLQEARNVHNMNEVASRSCTSFAEAARNSKQDKVHA